MTTLADGVRLPDNHRQIVEPNGTLIIREAIRGRDEGYYACSATNKEGLASKSGLHVIVQGESPRLNRGRESAAVHSS